MSRISRFVVLVTTVASLVGVMAATAGAVTWHNTGSTAFTATTGAGTLSSTAVNLACPSGTATGAAAGGSTVGPVYSVTGTMTYSGCLLVGQNVTLTCLYTMTGTVQPATNTTTGNFDRTCGLTLGGDSGPKLCHTEGSRHFIYANPGHRHPTWAVIILTTATVTITGSSCPAGVSDTGIQSEETLVVSAGSGAATMGPIITRTA